MFYFGIARDLALSHKSRHPLPSSDSIKHSYWTQGEKFSERCQPSRMQQAAGAPPMAQPTFSFPGPPTRLDKHFLKKRHPPEDTRLGDQAPETAHSRTSLRHLCSNRCAGKTSPMPIKGQGEGSGAAKPHCGGATDLSPRAGCGHASRGSSPSEARHLARGW